LGLDRGYCQMIGGEDKIVKHLDPIFKTLAPAGRIPRTPDAKGERHRGRRHLHSAHPARAIS